MSATLTQERARATFPVKELTHLLYGGEEKSVRIEQLNALVQSDPAFRKDDRYFLSRPEFFKRGLAMQQRLRDIKDEHDLSIDEMQHVKSAVGLPLPIDLHVGLFIPTIMGQCDDEQLEYWFPLATSLKVIGCYCQTELGHGSNVRGIETTATFIPETDEFDIHSPTLTSTKWWVGALGKVANHAAVFARLIVADKDYGIHPFIVPLRSFEDHQPLPGVIVGDIGPKHGYNAVDNGFARFDHVRIPRRNMLMKYSKLSRDGVYSKPPHEKIAYGVMVVTRANIVNAASHFLQRAVTIATRYSAVRRQFGDGSDGREQQILDYKMQQYQLLPLIATSYAFHFTGEFMMSLYESSLQGLKSGDVNAMADVHITSSGLKALTTWTAHNGMETCRRCCGGHGYMMASGLPEMVQSYAPNTTFEGDNVVLSLQTARSVLKTVKQARKGNARLGKNFRYLEGLSSGTNTQRCNVRDAADFRNFHVQVAAFERVALNVALRAEESVTRGLSAGLSQTSAQNEAAVDLVALSDAHCILMVVETFNSRVQEMEATHPNLYTVMKRVADLFALYNLESRKSELLECGYMSQEQVQALRLELARLLDEVRPDAVPLVDAFNLSDFVLNSALGRFDGNVYESLFESARKSTLNENGEVVYGYQEHLKPLITQSKL